MTTTHDSDLTQAKLTQHQDYTVSLRLRRHGDGTDRPSMDMVLHGLEQAANLFHGAALKCAEGRGMAGEGPEAAGDYQRLADRYRDLARQVAQALR